MSTEITTKFGGVSSGRGSPRVVAAAKNTSAFAIARRRATPLRTEHTSIVSTGFDGDEGSLVATSEESNTHNLAVGTLGGCACSGLGSGPPRVSTAFPRSGSTLERRGAPHADLLYAATLGHGV